MAQSPAPGKAGETVFEKRRGISSVEVRGGYAQVHVRELGEPLSQSRLGALDSLAKAGVSLDFLKLTPSGMSFVIKEDEQGAVEAALASLGGKVSIRSGQDVVMVYAVNMRDEEGLIASIVLQAIKSGASVGHVSDMHDRALMVVGKEDSARLKEQLEGNLAGVQA